MTEEDEKRFGSIKISKQLIGWRSYTCARSLGYTRTSSILSSPAHPVLDSIPRERGSKAMRRSSVTSVTKNSTTERQKRVVINKSSIHAIGAFAGECIKKGDFVIEYMGEVIGSKLADQRERDYNACGIGSSYLFRIDDVCVVDATIVGNLARFLNHSCDPNCVTKIIQFRRTKKICIYAKRDIQIGEELCYDYKFPYEDMDSKIPCRCGMKRCRKYMN